MEQNPIIEQLINERDRARSLAVALEAELATAMELISRLEAKLEIRENENDI